MMYKQSGWTAGLEASRGLQHIIIPKRQKRFFASDFQSKPGCAGAFFVM